MPTQHRARSHPNGMGQANESVPNPDPTSRTLESSERAVHNLEKYIEVQIRAMGEEAKLSTKGLVLTSANDQERERLACLREVFEQKIINAQLQISSVREVQKVFQDGAKAVLEETIKGRDVALAAALKAQQEQANLVQTHQKEALVQQQILFTTKSGAQDKEIADLRSRLDKGEGVATGTTTTHTVTREDQADQRSARDERRQSSTLTVYMIAVAITLFGLLLSAGVSIAIHFIP